MDVNGRHILINCAGEGDEPPVSVDSLCDYISHRFGGSAAAQEAMAAEICAYIEEYEGGARVPQKVRIG